MKNLIRLCFVTISLVASQNVFGVIRDGGIDPANLGQGGWIYILSAATNHLSPTTTPSVTNENSMFQYLKSQGLSFVIVKAATSNMLWTGSGNVPIGSPGAQFTKSLCDAAHANGLKIFGSNRSYGNDIPGEIAVADYVFQQGADGFIWDAEAEWESSNAWIGTNGPALAWQLCSTVRSNWPTKFLAHNPFDTLYLHSSFPYKEFGYWSDVVMPQAYHHSASKGNAIAAIHWTDVNFKNFQDSLYTLPETNINGVTVNWTNAIKPLVMMRDVYNGGAGTPVHPDSDVRDFLDYLIADPNCVTVGGYNGSSYFRSELHSAGQWANIKAATIGQFPGVVNNIVIDDANASIVGAWKKVKTIDATVSTVTFSGETGKDTNSFGTNYWRKTAGNGSSYIQFTPKIVTAGDYDVFQWHPNRSDASDVVPFVINFNGGSSIVFSNQKTNGGNWTLLGRFAFAAGTNGTIRVTDDIPGNNVAMVDGLKLVFVAPTGVPSVPVLLTATGVSPTQIDLAWNDTSSDETTFIVSRATSPSGVYTDIATLGPNSTSYSDAGLCDLTTFYYAVRAVNSKGESTPSNQATGTTQGYPPIILDNPEVSASIGWSIGNAGSNIFGTYFQYAATVSGSATASVTYQPNILVPGKYNVYVWYPKVANASSNAQVLIFGNNITTVSLNQTTGSGEWRLAAALQDFSVGTNNFVRISNNSGEANKIVVADAVRFDYVGAPCICTQPASQSGSVGDNFTFEVVASGPGSLSYQWQFNGEDIAGATSNTLLLSNAQTYDSGEYTVRISNFVGETVSVPVTLTVRPAAAKFSGASLLPGQGIQFSFSASVGITYRIETSTDLIHWTPLTNVFNLSDTMHFTDSTATNASRFYRAMVSP